MPIRPPRTHWLRGNKGERTPKLLIVADTEARSSGDEKRELQELRCWALRVIRRPPTLEQPTTWEEFWGFDKPSLTERVNQSVRPGQSWRLFTHNLSYDLGLTRLPLELIAAGWQIGQHNLASDGPWAHLKQNRRSLWLCDSASWFPVPLDRLGEILGLAKLPLPDELAPESTWLERCRQDVHILATALCRVLDEWDRRQLGWWSITGPASGWNTFLHFPNRGRKPEDGPAVRKSQDPHLHKAGARTLIVPDPQAREFERLALYSGRRDVWHVGKLEAGPWAEIDLKTAHLTICATSPLPYRRWAPFHTLGLDDWRLETSGAGLVAECVVSPRTPRYPCRLSGTVLHPVGQFATVLAGPEIADARERGELVSIGAGYGYHLGYLMQEWANWSLAILNSEPAAVDPLFPVLIKGWSRSVPGRWGMTHARQIKSGPSHVTDWALEPISVGLPPRRGYIFHLAGQWQESVADQESDDSFPAVLAYIQSYCRLALNRMLDVIAPRELASCNTEGAWVSKIGLDEVGAWEWTGVPEDYPGDEGHLVALSALSRVTAPLTVQIKQTAQELQVLSPQHIKADGRRLYSGVPAKAVEIEPERYSFMTWPKLKGQIERGDPRGYVRERRIVRLAGVPVSRWSFQDGHCEPVEVCWSPESGNVIQPPREDLSRLHGPLRPFQHPALKKALP